ncbi:RICIN domain-containing protein [Larkinella sp.]|uniref:RICIN domain-containing protein n=1 Tax=Larkinella sp. TaxID=2034517 RepID=UPI003BADB2CF
MKRFLLVALLLFASVNAAKAQGQVPNLRPSLSPQSPNVASLGRFGEHPVSLNTGIPSITVPVFNISAGQVRVPVSFDYHAGGHKVTDQASWVGLGWALNTGGVISRSVTGRPDEQSDILYWPGVHPNLDPNVSGNTDCDNIFFYFEQYNNRVYDSGYDVFNLTFPGGRTLKFVLIPDGTGSVATTMPFERVKISLIQAQTGTITGFTVTDEDGIVYTFDQTESVAFNNGSGQLSYTSAWQLSKIQGNRPDDLVQFYYTSVSHTSTTDIVDTQTIVDQTSGDCSFAFLGNQNFTSAAVSTYHTTRQLQEIVFPGGKLTFTPEAANRADIPGLKALDYIDVYGFNISSNTFQRIKRIDLQQGYFPTIQPQNYSYLSAPLKLNAVLMQDINNGIISKYLFEYNMTQNLPGTQSRSRDVWGYYNGASNPTTLIPVQTVNLYGTAGYMGSTTVGGANRSCSDPHMQAWILNKITYPTGGYSRFFYESNRYFDAGTNAIQLAGGLRVNRIETQASANDPLKVKTYRYGSGENGYGALNVTLNKSSWSNVYSEQLPPDCRQQTRVFGSNPTSSISPFDGSPVTYPEVAEYEGTYNGSNENGKTVYTFRTSGDVTFGVGGGNSGRTYVASYHWDRGQLLTRTVYNQANQMLHRQVNTYMNPIKTEVAKVGVLILKNLTYTTEWATYYSNPRTPPPCDYLRNQYTPPTYYPWPKGNIRLFRTEAYQYPAGNGNAVATSTETVYNADYQPAQQTVTAADGSITVRQMRYAFDLSFPTPASGPTRGIQLLRNRGQRNSIIEEYAYRKSYSADPNPYLIGGQLNLFEENSLVPGYALPKETHRLQVMDRCCLLSSYVPLSLTNSTTNKDPRYGLELTYTAYDSRANPLEYVLRNGLRTRLEWNVYNPGIVPFSVFTSETSNYNTAASLTTRYAYDVPLLGVKTTTDPNGFATQYEYDNFGRLDAIRDHDLNLLKTFDYNYANGEQNPKKLAPFSTVNSSVGSGCFLIYNALSGKVLQTMNDNTVQQQTPVGGQTNQIWRFDQQPNNTFKLTTQNGSGQALQTNSANQGEFLRIGNYTGTNLQLWNFNETAANSRQYRVSLSAGLTWDIEGAGAGPKAQLYGSMTNPGDFHYNQPYRFFQLLSVSCPGCSAPIPALSANPASICPGQTATLTANGCTGGTITWSTGAIGNTLLVNNSGTYLATCTLNGCTSAAGQVTVQTNANCAGGDAVGNGCFVISSVYSGKAMQVMSDNTIQQQTRVVGQANQIWKFEQQGNGQYKLTSQNGSGQVASVNAAGNGELVRLAAFTNTTLQFWSFSQTAAGSGQYRVHQAAGNTWDLRSRGVDPELQLWGSVQNTSDPDYAGTYRIFRLTSVGCPTSPNCYSLRLVANGKRLTNANGTLKIQDPDDSQNGQIWKIDPVGSSTKLTTMSGTGLVISAAGGNQTLDTDLVLQSYTGQAHQHWTQQLVNDGNPGMKYGFVSNNGSFAWSSVYNWGGGNPSAPAVSDFTLKPVADLLIYGAMKWFLDSRTCPW